MLDPRRPTSAWLTQQCGTGAFSRGSRYFRERRARLDHCHDDGSGTFKLLGVCRGNASHPYRQHIEIIDGPVATPELAGFCTCPVGYNCKHVVALVLTWQADADAARNSADRVEAWLAELDADEEADTTAAESLLYIVTPGANDCDAWCVHFAIARRKRDGDWAKGRSANLSTLADDWQPRRYMQRADEDIVGFLELCNRSAWVNHCELAGTAGRFALLEMARTGRLFIGPERRGPIAAGPARRVDAAWKQTAQRYRLEMQVEHGGSVVDVTPPCYLDEARLQAGPLDLPGDMDAAQFDWLRRAPEVDADRAAAISRHMALRAPGVPTPRRVDFVDVDAPPVPRLAVEFDPDAPERARARLSFRYGALEVSPDRTDTVVTGEAGDRLVRARRDPAAEQRALARAREAGLGRDGADGLTVATEAGHGSLRQAWLDWWNHRAPELESEGWIVEHSGGGAFRLSEAAGVDGEVDAGGDWFSLRFDLEFDGWRMPLVPLITQVLEQYRPDALPETLYLDAGEGHFVAVPSAELEPVLRTVLELMDRVDDDELRLARPDATRLLDLEGIPIKGATSLRNLARKLADFSGLRTVDTPTTFKAELRPYQQHGLDWLQFLREHGFGGILADDMGLGKTVQTLANLTVEKRAGRLREPCLIVAPSTLMGNWRREAERFAPRLEVLVLHGPERTRWFDRLAEFDLVLTTYPLLPRDRETLLAQSWHYVILDEAQRIKNPKAQAAQVVRRLDCRHRLCLTGTPVENHLGELWAQFDFLMPGFLGDAKHFKRTFRTPIEQHGDGERLASLNRRTAPFLLRRTKDTVAAELPPKSEVLRTAAFDGKQARLYESVRLTMEKKVTQAVAARGLARSHIVVLEALLKLRQVCCDPRLLREDTPGARGAPSAKFDLLFELLPELLAEGRRVLLFSQFTSMLDLIERELARRDIAYAKLTGRTRKRDAAIQRFRDGKVDLFLISLKAGGVGLNLVEADAVIHYDPWWNPAVEHQATDRAHRIGQDKPVFVYKLMTEGTVEERILALQDRKRNLAEAVQGGRRAHDQPPIDAETIQALLGVDARELAP